MRSRIARNLEWLLAPRHRATSSLRAMFDAAPSDLSDIPSGFSAHDYAVYLLHIAAEIEHVLMVQYLYAAYSLGGPQVPARHQETVRRWQEIVLGIAKEEMGHLITVENILRLIGGPLNLDRNDMPWDAPFYPFAFALEPLSRTSLARYVYAESPKEWPSDVSAAEKAEIIRTAQSGQQMPMHQVGDLYRLMIQIIGNEDLLADDLFQADTLPYQASWDEWGRGYHAGARGADLTGGKTPDVLVLTAYSRGAAVQALQAVARQGEAEDVDPDTNDRSHFRRFLEIYRAFPKDADGWTATTPVASNPRTMGGDTTIPDTAYISDPQSRAWAELFNLRYRMLLLYLSHAFRLSGARAHHLDTRARGLIVHHTFGEMYNLRTIAKTVMQMPLGGTDASRLAGPPFEMPYSIALPAEEHDCWRLHLDLLEASATLSGRIAAFTTGRLLDYLKSLDGIDRETAQAIARMMDSRCDARERSTT